MGRRLYKATALAAACLALGCQSGPVGGEDGPIGTEVPLGAAAERSRLDYEWDPVTERVHLAGASRGAVVAVGSRRGLVGTELVDLGHPVRIVGGRVVVAEDYGRRVDREIEAAPRVVRRDREPVPYVAPPSHHRPSAPTIRQPDPSESIVRIAPPTRRGVLLLDPGHGGKDPGTVHDGTLEKEIVLDICRRAIGHLEAVGYRVFLTRTDDRFIDLDERVAMVDRVRADLFVSVHVNANGRSDVMGLETYYKSNGDHGQTLVDRSKRLAEIVHSAVRTVVTTRDRGVRTDQRGLRVLRTNRVPAILAELGFVSNAQERALLESADYRERLARALAAGLARWDG